MPICPHPQVHATVYGSTATLITPRGDQEVIDATAGQDVRGQVLTRAATIASELQVSVELQTTGDRGEHRLLVNPDGTITRRSEEHTSELQSLMRTSYAVFCLK